MQAKGDESELHVIILDELDAICRQRGTTRGDTGVGDSVVNQLLSFIDGVEALNNILIIGMPPHPPTRAHTHTHTHSKSAKGRPWDSLPCARTNTTNQKD